MVELVRDVTAYSFAVVGECVYGHASRRDNADWDMCATIWLKLFGDDNIKKVGQLFNAIDAASGECGYRYAISPKFRHIQQLVPVQNRTYRMCDGCYPVEIIFKATSSDPPRAGRYSMCSGVDRLAAIARDIMRDACECVVDAVAAAAELDDELLYDVDDADASLDREEIAYTIRSPEDRFTISAVIEVYPGVCVKRASMEFNMWRDDMDGVLELFRAGRVVVCGVALACRVRFVSQHTAALYIDKASLYNAVELCIDSAVRRREQQEAAEGTSMVVRRCLQGLLAQVASLVRRG